MTDSAPADTLSYYRDEQQVTAAVSKGQLWVSSPNADFVPEVPVHSRDEEFGYYADGMLGSFEHLKWPQVFDSMEPHTAVAPANPMLLQCTRSKLAGPDPLPPLDFLTRHPRERISTGIKAPLGLGNWKDDAAPWFSFNEHDWRAETFGRDLGRLDVSIITRLRDAAKEANGAYSYHGMSKGYNDRTMAYADRQSAALTMALNGLDRTLPLGQAIQWFRECQRLLLDLRAWHDYMAIFKPRIETAPQAKPAPVTPVRGVITGSLNVLQTMYRVGIPVWWVRPINTLDRTTWIQAVVEPTPWKDVFAKRKTKKLGNFTVEAPAWKDGVAVDNAHAGFAQQLRRYQLSSKPVVAPPRPIIPDAPDDPPTMTATLEDIQASAPVAHAGPSNAPEAPAPPAKKARSSRKGKGKETASSAPTVVSRDVPTRPSWLPATNVHWAPIEAKLASLSEVQNAKPIQYSLPPFHAFTGNVALKMHNWLRIRPHCFLAVHSQEERPTTLTASGWKVALDGSYHSFEQRPHAKHRSLYSPDLIAQLPPHPATPPTLGKRREPHQSSRTLGGQDKRVAEKLNVAVHFGVMCGFPPYHPDDRPLWRNQLVSASRTESDQLLWQEVVWQLSIKHFRLELLQLDEEIMAEIGEPSTYQRHLDWLGVWNGGLDVTTDPANLDYILSEDWIWRRAGVLRLRALVHAWPDFGDSDIDNMEVTISPSAFNAYEVTLYEAYARYFYKRRGRLPTFPLARPSSIAEREN
ncbi:hypothetical protein FA95DRAFT_1612817 [Auriscalpium vulgare]|uniref:Uncharacterized protein n=1 Tax=Auriscalpium vulgare TaxID=40419 RepID=A0ACB8R6C0_9AGAM|nr:hypothetical protein FA95DRAFT_1612817 [Auriscalpium vulgare]